MDIQPTTTASREDGSQQRAPAMLKDGLTPKAIVAALDEHIIGQDDAKKAVAVALRNRWRRQRLSPELRDEVTPKNILMIGPTGCGKTEISRRLARLADAPFVKVEATKFTEVGYVGRDVEQIARDLVEEAVRLERERRREKVREASEGAAMERLLDALTGKGSSEATRASFRQRAHFAPALLAHHVECDLHKIAYDLLDVAADIADFRELGRFHFEERRLRQLSETARDFGLSHTGRADHQDVLRRHFLAQVLRHLLAPPTVAQCDRDGAFGFGLADDKAIEFGDDFARGKVGHRE